MLFILCILILILLYIVKSYKIFDFDFRSKSILTFIVVDFNYFILYHEFVNNVKYHKKKLEFMTFDISGMNYISWIYDAK